MKNPFTANIEEADTTCQELLEIRYDEEKKVNINSTVVDMKTYGKIKKKCQSYIQICGKWYSVY